MHIFSTLWHRFLPRNPFPHGCGRQCPPCVSSEQAREYPTTRCSSLHHHFHLNLSLCFLTALILLSQWRKIGRKYWRTATDQSASAQHASLQARVQFQLALGFFTVLHAHTHTHAHIVILKMVERNYEAKRLLSLLSSRARDALTVFEVMCVYVRARFFFLSIFPSANCNLRFANGKRQHVMRGDDDDDDAAMFGWLWK